MPVKGLSVALGLLLAGAGLFAVYRAGGGTPTSAGVREPELPVGVEDARRMVVLEIARIDLRLEDASLAEDDRTELDARRAELVSKLSDRP